MKVKDIYENLYKSCDEILGSFLMFIVVNYGKYFSEQTIKTTIKRFSNYSASSFEQKYQEWYTNSLIVLSAFCPERKKEFVDLYEPDLKRKGLTGLTYKISDAISGYSNDFSNPTHSINQIRRQIDIIKSLKGVIDSKIYDIKLYLIL